MTPRSYTVPSACPAQSFGSDVVGLIVFLAVLLAAVSGALAQPQSPPQVVIGGPNGVAAGLINNSTFNLRGLSDEDRRALQEHIDKLVGELRGELASTIRILGGQLETSGAARAQAEANAARVGDELKLTRGAATQLLAALGQQNVPPERVAERLRDAVVQYRETLERLDALQGSRNPAVRALREEARMAFIGGRFDEADHLSRSAAEAGIVAAQRAHELRERAEQAERELLLNAADDWAITGDVAATRLRYAEAAQLYAKAASTVPRTYLAERGRYLAKEAFALHQEGSERGNNTSLHEALAVCTEALSLTPRGERPLEWATIKINLGNVLSTLGERENGTTRLEEAVAAYRAGLEELTRKLAPFEWALTQNDLGLALSKLGEQETGTTLLEEAVAVYLAALEEQPRERMPLEWALTQNNLGGVLSTLGERKNSTALLEVAVATYRAALEERTRERVPLDWAATENNLGAALWMLSKRENNIGLLEEVVSAYRAALEEQTRERKPLAWATTQFNLGLALKTLGERESGTAQLEEAVTAYHAALEEQARDQVPLQWARTQNNLGNALQMLGERESGTARLEEAAAAFRAALDEQTREKTPDIWAMMQNNLGITLQAIGERESGTARLAEAVAAYDACLEVTASVWSRESVVWVRKSRDRAMAELERRKAR